MNDECEEIARRASEESTLDDRPRADPRLLAVGYLGLRLRPAPRAHSQLRRDVIVFDPTLAPDAQAYLIAHECGHWLLRDEGWRLDPVTEERAASRIAAALLLPRRAYLRDLRDVGWDVARLHDLWPLASMWIHARRIAELASDGAIVSRWDARACRDRIISTGIVAPRSVTLLERQLVAPALDGRAHALAARLRAWPADRGAIAVCAVEELETFSSRWGR